MTLTISDTLNAERLAKVLREGNLPGRASVKTIRTKRRQRAQQRAEQPAPVRDSRMRLWDKLAAEARAEVERRGGETVIAEQCREVPLTVIDRDKRSRIVLVAAHGWRQYSKTFGARRAGVVYLYGKEPHGGPWAVRVPATITTVAEALEWLEPAEVTKARAAGKRVRRQGDVYLVETTQAHDGRGLDTVPNNHRWNPSTRYFTHRPDAGGRHRPVHAPWPVRFVVQRPLEMGRGAGRGAGD